MRVDELQKRCQNLLPCEHLKGIPFQILEQKKTGASLLGFLGEFKTTHMTLHGAIFLVLG